MIILYNTFYIDTYVDTYYMDDYIIGEKISFRNFFLIDEIQNVIIT